MVSPAPSLSQKTGNYVQHIGNTPSHAAKAAAALGKGVSAAAAEAAVAEDTAAAGCAAATSTPHEPPLTTATILTNKVFLLIFFCPIPLLKKFLICIIS